MVDIEFEYFHDNWEADGKPTGGKNSRSNASFLKSDCSTFFSFYEWLISVPAWAQGNSEASKFLIGKTRFLLSTFIVHRAPEHGRYVIV